MEFGVFATGTVGPKPWDESEPKVLRADVQSGIVETRPGQPQPLLSSIKAADLSVYPYYGTIEFDPPEPEMADNAVIAQDV